MKFEKGDIVRFIEGSVDWEVHYVVEPGRVGQGWYVLKSGMTQRRRSAFERELKPWRPHA